MRNRIKKFLRKTTKLFVKGKALHQICDAIKEAQDLAKELADLRKRYELDIRSTSKGATIDPRVLALHKDVGELVGVDRTRDELIKTLICEDGSPKEQLKTISIVGVGGLGKTTLAKAIYEKIKGQFDCAAFVPMGQNPDIKKVFKDLLFGLDKEKFSGIHNTTRDQNLLIKEISDFLVDKSMGCLPSLEHVQVCLLYGNTSDVEIATDEEIETAMACLRRAAQAHPKRPTIEFTHAYND